MWGTKIHYRHMWARGAVIEEATRKRGPLVWILAATKHMIFEPEVSRLCSWQLFNWKSSCGPYQANRPVGGRQVLNDLKRRNYQNESCRSLKFMKLRSWRLFIWNHLVDHIGQIGLSAVHWLKVLNYLGWRNYQNESCRSRKVMKLCCWQFFHLKSFRASNNQFMLNLV
jgi:hypothetical protein